MSCCVGVTLKLFQSVVGIIPALLIFFSLSGFILQLTPAETNAAFFSPLPWITRKKGQNRTKCLHLFVFVEAGWHRRRTFAKTNARQLLVVMRTDYIWHFNKRRRRAAVSSQCSEIITFKSSGLFVIICKRNTHGRFLRPWFTWMCLVFDVCTFVYGNETSVTQKCSLVYVLFLWMQCITATHYAMYAYGSTRAALQIQHTMHYVNY